MEQQSKKKEAEILKEKSSEKYDLSLEGLLKAGVHFGHKKSRWNPKMNQYIFGVRNGVHIIDLEKTIIKFSQALEFLKDTYTQKGKSILLVGTKKQAKDLVSMVAKKAGIPYVNLRWLGGTLTNFDVILKRISYFNEKKEFLEKGKASSLTKLEKLKLNKKLEKIEERMGGLKDLRKLPQAVFVLDVIKDRLAIDEAHKLGIKVVGLVDTNGDPNLVDYPIPANDDALSSLKYILGVFLKSMLEAESAKNLVTEKKA